MFVAVLPFRRTRLLLFVIALAVLVFFHQPAVRMWTLIDHDGGGLYPAQDCGRNFWLIFRTPDGDCAVRGENADRVTREALKGMKPSEDAAAAMDDLMDRIARILEAIDRSWSMQ